MAVVYRALVEKLGAASTTTFVGNEGELFWDPTSTTVRISDGSTPGGVGIGGGSGGGGSYGDTDVEALFQSYDFHLLPSVNAQYDIGSAEFKVRHLFLSDNTLYYEGDFLKVAQHNAGGAAQTPSYMIPLAKLKEALNASADYEAFKAAILAIVDAA
tara:strand:+ start:19 stop:489 length:471 start_codon:yes stop_codon:yes gene_type:complete